MIQNEAQTGLDSHKAHIQHERTAHQVSAR